MSLPYTLKDPSDPKSKVHINKTVGINNLPKVGVILFETGGNPQPTNVKLPDGSSKTFTGAADEEPIALVVGRYSGECGGCRFYFDITEPVADPKPVKGESPDVTRADLDEND